VLFLSNTLPRSLTHAFSALWLGPGHLPAFHLCKHVKDEGNVACKVGHWEEAVERYGEALERIGEKVEEANRAAMLAVAHSIPLYPLSLLRRRKRTRTLRAVCPSSLPRGTTPVCICLFSLTMMTNNSVHISIWEHPFLVPSHSGVSTRST
jgi:hypothetical protein